MEELITKLDKRYVQKKDLEEEVVSVVNKNFLTSEDSVKVLQRMSAMEVEIFRNSDLLNKIYESSEETKQLQIRQKKETEAMKYDLEQSKKKPTTIIWDKTPRILRMLISVVSFYIILMVISMFIGQELANRFIIKNGAIVSMVTLIAGFYFSGKEGK